MIHRKPQFTGGVLCIFFYVTMATVGATKPLHSKLFAYNCACLRTLPVYVFVYVAVMRTNCNIFPSYKINTYNIHTSTQYSEFVSIYENSSFSIFFSSGSSLLLNSICFNAFQKSWYLLLHQLTSVVLCFCSMFLFQILYHVNLNLYRS